NVRELMGALNRLVAFQAVNDTSINAETVKQILGLAAGEGETAPPGDGRAAAAKSGSGDEFGEFLADVAVTVGKAVEAWRVREGGAPPPGPSAAFPLAAFAVGASNQVAVSAARAALERPGKKYNPLVLVGKSGLGKTHLLNAIGLELARGKRAVVACLSTQAFIDELISAIDG